MILRRTNVPWAQKNLQLHTRTPIQSTQTHTCVAKKHEEAFNELFSFVLALVLACDDKLRSVCPRFPLFLTTSLSRLVSFSFIFYFLPCCCCFMHMYRLGSLQAAASIWFLY